MTKANATKKPMRAPILALCKPQIEPMRKEIGVIIMNNNSLYGLSIVLLININTDLIQKPYKNPIKAPPIDDPSVSVIKAPMRIEIPHIISEIESNV
jgi:hypothetical protein